MGKHLPAIDGLRAFAVLSVVAYHAGLPLAAGYVGVDVFFVISGYVITRMLLSEPRIDLAAFYARRVRRILPALVVVVAATLALSAAMLSADLQIATNRSAMAAMAMGANVWFQLHTGYFDAASDSQPLLHLWSLAVEEQFYFVWPLLLITFRRKPWVLALLAVGSFVLWQTLSPNAAFYQMPARFWELAIGGLLVMAPKSRVGTLAGWAGLVVLLVSVTSGTLLAVVGSALVIYGIHSGVRLPLEWKPLRYVGLVSYSFYLWHWPLLTIAKASSFEAPTLQTNLWLCGLAFILASLSYHFIELPFRRTNAPKGRAIALGVTVCALLAGCAAAASTLPRATDAGQLPSVPRECYQTHLDAPALPPASCGKGPVVLWGDSHAQTWRPYADRFGKVYQLTRAGCPPSAIPLSRKPKSVRQARVAGTLHQWEDCTRFNALAVEQAKQGGVVILSVRWLGVYEDEARQGMTSALDALAEVPRVIVMGPLPVMPHDPALCVAKGRECSMPRAEFDLQAEPIRAFLRDATARHPNVEWVDLTDYLCNPTECPMAKDGVALYFDDNHISAQAAQAFTRR